MYIVFVGIQGSGKGTQANILKERFNFHHYETGKYLRELALKDTELGKKINEIISSGKQVSPKIVKDILINILKENDNAHSHVILDGFIRNKGNKDDIDEILKNYKVIYFKLPEEEAKKRLLGRMYDPKTGETFTAGTIKNPKTQDLLIKRNDDVEDAIKERIKQFYEKTMPIVEELRKEGKLIEIDSSGTIEEVFLIIKNKLNL